MTVINLFLYTFLLWIIVYTILDRICNCIERYAITKYSKQFKLTEKEYNKFLNALKKEGENIND